MKHPQSQALVSLPELRALTRGLSAERKAALVLKVWDVKTTPIPVVSIASDLGLPTFTHGNKRDIASSIAQNLDIYDKEEQAEFATCLLVPEWMLNPVIVENKSLSVALLSAIFQVSPSLVEAQLARKTIKETRDVKQEG